ncbi:mismatch repair endonuclease PMS2 [Betta splendens]|uniref:Mismatch repair endonuclease PMS2 n=1 Tax=Betta splendens TaxID=158456 RepID=A0A9W2XG84_BETSP|nr:mismatch repair endonuclease PMS2 [Betta splendens]
MTDICTSDPAGAIKAIDKDSVHQICSGQVVLTLATAVKELVENSIDAGATNIDIKLKDFGAGLVEVSDNGKGVEEANFEGLTLKHHTSKLTDFSDLIHVETFGFRGEALSSLCALSDLSVVTCHKSSQVGTKLVFDCKGHLVQRSPHPRQQGTTVSLQQLFYTLPVRHKEFQRNIKKEYNKLLHVLQSYCIISTGVRITCSNQNGQGKRSTILSTSGSQNMRDNIGALFGPKQLQSLLPFQQLLPTKNITEEYGLVDAELHKELFTITGFVSQGDHGVGRSATDRQFFFINNRPCDPHKVTKLVNEVYHMYNRHQYPFAALNIAVVSECVDVNVTPDKRQILLQEEKLLLAILKTSLINMYEAGVNKITLNSAAIPRTNTSSASELHKVSSSNENEHGQDVQSITQRPKSCLNLVGLKAAFSSYRSSTCGNKAEVKPANSDSSQKTLQQFFKSSVTPSTCNASGNVSVKSTRDLGKCSLVGNSVQGSFSYGKMCSGADDEKDIATSSEFTAGAGNYSSGMELSSHELMINYPSVQNEIFEGSSESTHAVSGNPDTEIQKEPCTSREDDTLSSDAKRSRKEDQHFSARCKPNTLSDSSEKSFSTIVDAPACLRKRIVHLKFSLHELAEKMRQLQDQHKETTGEKLCYRRFRAKINTGENQSAEEELKKEISKEMFKEMEIIGQFNLGFIITKLFSDIFMIDQHATDEKYNFEMLQQHTVLQGQKLIVPQKLDLNMVSENILIENIDIFRKNGFEFQIEEDAPVRVRLVSLPTSKNWTFGVADIEELIFMLSDSPGVMCRPSRVRQMFASRACRKSVMIGTALSGSEMKKLVNHMGEIEHPWNCPHGRPTMRHLVNLDVVSQH